MIAMVGLLIVLCEEKEYPLSWDLRMCAYNIQLGCQVYFRECDGNICQTSLVYTRGPVGTQCSVIGFLCFLEA
jgi:hypothetical protein